VKSVNKSNICQSLFVCKPKKKKERKKERKKYVNRKTGQNECLYKTTNTFLRVYGLNYFVRLLSVFQCTIWFDKYSSNLSLAKC